MSASHDCARPDTAGDIEPWRCPECGMLWETLPPAQAPRSKPKRASSTPVVVALVAYSGWMGASVWAILAISPVAGIASMGCLIVIAVAVAYWQKARS